MKVAFCTNISDEYYHSMGADKLIKSAKYFHPEIPFFCYGTTDVERIGVGLPIIMPFIINELIRRYDAVVRFDADSIITGPLTELLEALEKYEVVGVRNNNDFHKAGMDEPLGQPGAGTEHYMNAGLVGTTSKAFIEEWMSVNKMFGTMLPFGEQSVLNGIAQKYKTFIVDHFDSGVYYGVGGLYGEDTHWDSWKDISVGWQADNPLFLKDKQIKVLHHGGGFHENKLGFYMFNEQTRKRLIEITK